MKPDSRSSAVSRREFLAATAAVVPLRWEWEPNRRAAQDDLLELGAREAVLHIRNGDLKAEGYFTRLVEQYRAQRDLNAVNWIDEARVLELARSVDRARAQGRQLGAAAGLPFAVKDQIAVAGYPTSAGNGALKGYIPKRSAEVVERLVQAGGIPFCMTALPDMTVIDGLMHQASSHSDSFGAVHNPYDRSRIPGGSSGGNGAVLAARIVPAALGEDTNGSIRCPSAFCGVAGLRPSTWTIENALHGRAKRYSDAGILIPPMSRLDTIGPMARTVADVAFLDTIVTGAPVPAIDLGAVRIAVPRASDWEQDWVEAGVAKVMDEAFAKLREAGCTLVEVDFAGEVRSIVGTITEQTPATVIAALGLDPPDQSDEAMERWLKENAPGVTMDQMYRGRPRDVAALPTLPAVEEQRAILNEAARRYAEVYRSHGVVALAFPTIPMVATRIVPGGPKEPLGDMVSRGGRQMEEGRVLIQNLFIAPRLGAPGLSVPAGLSGGLPVGLELDALPGQDSELLGLGIAVQRVLGLLPRPALGR